MADEILYSILYPKKKYKLYYVSSADIAYMDAWLIQTLPCHEPGLLKSAQATQFLILIA